MQVELWWERMKKPPTFPRPQTAFGDAYESNNYKKQLKQK